jgi:hypothetical protein
MHIALPALLIYEIRRRQRRASIVPDPHLRSLSASHSSPLNPLGGDRPSEPERNDTGAVHAGFGLSTPKDSEQFAREIAAIERAADILRRAEPGLQSWAEPPATHNTPHPLWLIIGTLWVSTALVALSAVFALYVLAS